MQCWCFCSACCPREHYQLHFFFFSSYTFKRSLNEEIVPPIRSPITNRVIEQSTREKMDLFSFYLPVRVTIFAIITFLCIHLDGIVGQSRGACINYSFLKPFFKK